MADNGVEVADDLEQRRRIEDELAALRQEVADLRVLASEVEEIRRTVVAAATLSISLSRVSLDAGEESPAP